MNHRDVHLAHPEAAEVTARKIQAHLDAGGDPRRAIADLNAEVVAFQLAGADLPATLIRLTCQIVAGYRPAGGERLYN